MTTIIKSLMAVLSVAAVLGGAASAADAGKGSKSGNLVASRPLAKGPVSKGPLFSSPKYHLTHGAKFSHGYYFRGREHRHFRYRHWSSQWHTYMYYYPGTHGWYYWSGKRNAYYPMSYANVVAPSGDANANDMDSLPTQLPPGVPPPPASPKTDDDDEA